MQPSRMDRNRAGSAALYTIGLTNAGVGQNLRDRPSRDFKPRGILVPGGVRSWKAKLRTRRSSSFSVLYPMSLIAISLGDDWTSISGSSSGRREKDFETWRETCSFRLTFRAWDCDFFLRAAAFFLSLAFLLWRPPVCRGVSPETRRRAFSRILFVCRGRMISPPSIRLNA